MASWLKAEGLGSILQIGPNLAAPCPPFAVGPGTSQDGSEGETTYLHE